MTKAEATRLLKQRMKIVRVSIFGQSNDRYADSPLLKVLKNKLIAEGKAALEARLEPHKEEVQQFIDAYWKLEEIVKADDEIWLTHSYTSAYKHTVEIDDIIHLRGAMLADIHARDEMPAARAKFDLKCLELEEQLLIKYSEDPQKAEEFLKTLPDTDSIMEELLGTS